MTGEPRPAPYYRPVANRRLDQCAAEKYVWHGLPNDLTAGYEVLLCTLPAGHFPSGRHVCDEGAVISSWDGEGWRSFRHVKDSTCVDHSERVVRCLTCGYERLPTDLCPEGRSLLTCTQQAGGGWLTRRAYTKHVKRCPTCAKWEAKS